MTDDGRGSCFLYVRNTPLGCFWYIYKETSSSITILPIIGLLSMFLKSSHLILIRRCFSYHFLESSDFNMRFRADTLLKIWEIRYFLRGVSIEVSVGFGHDCSLLYLLMVRITCDLWLLPCLFQWQNL